MIEKDEKIDDFLCARGWFSQAGHKRTGINTYVI